MTFINFAGLSDGINFETVNIDPSVVFTASSTLFDFNNSGGDEVRLEGSGLTFTGGDPTGGVFGGGGGISLPGFPPPPPIRTLEIDIDNNQANGNGDVVFTGSPIGFVFGAVQSYDAADFQFDSLTGADLRENFFNVLLQGNDFFDLTNVGSFTTTLNIAGDGGDAPDTGSALNAGDDIFNGGVNGFSIADIFGDFIDITGGVQVIGGNDVFSVSADIVSGDAENVSGTGSILIGGNDSFEADAFSGLQLDFVGDAEVVSSGATVIGGNDSFDFSNTDVSGIFTNVEIFGDSRIVSSGASISGGSDNITGSDTAELIYGDIDISTSGFAVIGGNDVIDGGAGDDTIFGDGDNIGSSVGLARGGIDRILGGDGNDLIFGDFNGEAENIEGARDVIIAGNGDDTIFGGGGDDRIVSGDGADEINGGSGNDGLVGGDDNDILSGGLGDDGLNGGTGNDTLMGDEGNDSFLAGGGADSLIGGSGNDTLNGGGNNDILEGGTGNDILTGAFNADRFVFSGNFGDDIITDFADNNAFERIDLSDVTTITDLTDLFTNHLSLVDGVATIDDGNGNTITLQGITTTSNLDATDFIF